MAHRRLIPQNKGVYNLSKFYYFPKSHPLTDGIGRNLPAAYKRYYEELNQNPSAVHHIPVKEKFARDPNTGFVTRLQDDPPNIFYPKAFHKGLWGGAGIVKGFNHPHVKLPRLPKFWSPKFETSVVYSEVLDLFMTTIMTKRTIQLIHKYYGFDHYLLQTPACDLKSDLALKIKRNILLALDKNDLPHTDPEKRQQIYDTYKHYLKKYDSEYIEWYGLSIAEAVLKFEFDQEKARGKPQPLKLHYRHEFLKELQEDARNEVKPVTPESRLTSFFDKINPRGCCHGAR